MVIIYNPLTGSKIEHFIYANVGELAPHDIGEIKQYDPKVGEVLLKTFAFLQEVTPKKAEEIIAKPKEGAIKCEYCEFSTNYKVALTGHLRSHKDEIAKAKEPQIDPSIVPIAEATPVEPLRSVSERNQEEMTENLSAEDGFYGEGLTISKG